MHRFLVVIEKVGRNYSAYSPDLPGCIATGRTPDETEKRMHEAVQLHVAGLMQDHRVVPKTSSFAEYVAVG